MTDESGKRLQLLEENFEFQESTIDTLNQVIIDQQGQLDKLEEKINRLEGLLLSVQTESLSGGGEEPPPPHY
jgi:SlyX protein